MSDYANQEAVQAFFVELLTMVDTKTVYSYISCCRFCLLEMKLPGLDDNIALWAAGLADGRVYVKWNVGGELLHNRVHLDSVDAFREFALETFGHLLKKGKKLTDPEIVAALEVGKVVKVTVPDKYDGVRCYAYAMIELPDGEPNPVIFDLTRRINRLTPEKLEVLKADTWEVLDDQ